MKITNDEIAVETKVRTVEPAERGAWSESIEGQRRWNVYGQVHGRHGDLYRVLFDDGSQGLYARNELQRRDVEAYTPAEREELIAKMDKLAGSFYSHAVRIGVHAFIEFAGLMNEFIQVCRDANRANVDFAKGNAHTGVMLPFQPFHAAYLGEKMQCIYGTTFEKNKAVRDAFIQALFEGAYKLVPVTPARTAERPKASL